MELVLDIEADELLEKATRMWIIGWIVLETGEREEFLEGDMRWIQRIEEIATVIIGHNVSGYDLLLLEKLFGYKLPAHIKVRDTQIMSQVLNYNRFPSGIHKLAEWGELLGFPKIDFDDFSQYSPEMHTYWIRDLELNVRVYKRVMKDLHDLMARIQDPEKRKNIQIYLRAEQAVNRWFGICGWKGWPFDVPAATALLEKMEAELQIVRDKLLPRLGTKVVAKDKSNGVVTVKVPKFRKDGAYDSHTCKWFGIDEWSSFDDRLVEGPYCRVEFVDLSVDSITDMKIFLFRLGWVPTEWNMKKGEDGEFHKTSPKITEDSLDCLEGDGKLYCDFLTTSSRVGILKGWLKHTDANGRLHGSGFTIGTPSMRARHNLIVNVPSADSKWGKEMRALFISEPGWTLVGCDSAGNQARGLAHYLRSPEYVDLLLNGDIHMFNANAIDGVLKEMGIDWNKHLIEKEGVKADAFDPSNPDKKLHTLEENLAKKKRGVAKRILYAFLFGASGGKLWSYIFGIIDDEPGKKFKLGFTKAVPGFKELLDKLARVYAKTKQYGDGHIPGIAGNKIYCNSFHKLLVYLLQSCEKATCAAATMLTMERLEAAGIPYQPCIMYHDEIDFMVPDEFAEQAAAIGKQAFVDGPKLYGITIMDGDSKIGKSWYEIH